MRRAAWVLAAACTLTAGPAAAMDVLVEPVQAGLLRMDAFYVERAGVHSREAVHLGLGGSVGWRDWQLGLALGRATAGTDFGLLAGPDVRLERADLRAELRWRTPLQCGGWALQAVAGVGRLALRYHPSEITIVAGGETVAVTLDETRTWTRLVAAEVLHGLRDTAWIVLRAGASFYALDVATPTGTVREGMSDVQAGVLLRARMH